MEDFFSETRFMGGEEPPFAVLMAAFIIREKRFYDWASAKFKMFLRDGSEKEFLGGGEAEVAGENVGLLQAS
jgi:hypothetical protein